MVEFPGNQQPEECDKNTNLSSMHEQSPGRGARLKDS
jgi:hypothetical protein